MELKVIGDISFVSGIGEVRHLFKNAGYVETNSVDFFNRSGELKKDHLKRECESSLLEANFKGTGKVCNSTILQFHGKEQRINGARLSEEHLEHYGYRSVSPEYLIWMILDESCHERLWALLSKGYVLGTGGKTHIAILKQNIWGGSSKDLIDRIMPVEVSLMRDVAKKLFWSIEISRHFGSIWGGEKTNYVDFIFAHKL